MYLFMALKTNSLLAVSTRHLYMDIRIVLLNSVSRITGTNVANLENEALVKLLLYGNEKKYSIDIKRKILLCTINFLTNNNRF